MKTTVSRVVTALFTSAALVAGGIGMATAVPVDREHASVITSTADDVQYLHDQLAQAVEDDDVEAVDGVLGQIDRTMQVILTAEQYERAAAVRADAEKARDLGTRLQAKLTQARGDDPLATLNGLIQTLLATLSALVDNLLGGGTPGVPDVPGVPGVPGVPDVPEVPETPDLPEVPEAPGLPPAPLP
ncbi:hypothetical protein [Thermocrispum sp.]|uniref:hypothetical protein n=1 Tax=Thermocrispum sp. TaxID=2060768 RepID=UPI00258017B1|nr:hypothetical protein [Thermocrispum sp.]